MPSLDFSRKAINKQIDHKVDSAVDKNATRIKRKKTEKANQNQSDNSAGKKKVVPKQQVADCLEGKLTSNIMMNTNLPAGFICKWRHMIKKM